MHTLNYMPFFVTSNNMIHVQHTQNSVNVHINTVFAIDERNFVYNCILNRNNCPLP